MKPLFIILSLIAFNDFLPAADQSEGKEAKEEIVSFTRMDAIDGHLFIHKWSDPAADGSFLLSVEPGCILLRVKQESFTDRVCRLQIIGSPAGKVMIEHAKKTLGIQTDIFDIHYKIEKQESEGIIFPSYNRILEVKDSKANPKDSFSSER